MTETRTRKERLDAWLAKADAVLAEYDRQNSAAVQNNAAVQNSAAVQNNDVQRRLISRSREARPSTLPRQTAMPASSAAFCRSVSMKAV